MEQLLKEMAWHQTMAKLIESINRPSFWSLLTHTIGDYVRFDNWVCLQFNGGEMPVVLAESAPQSEQEDRLFRDYLHSFYRQDPFYQAANSRISSGLIRLDDIISEQFDDSDYYQRYFRLNIVGDEVQFNHPMSDGSTLCLSLGKHDRFQPQDMAMLTLIQPWVLALMVQRFQYEQQLQPEPIQAGTDQLVAPNCQIQSLTSREQEVCQHMLDGLAVKQIAQRMDISVETVRAHKKHIYSKLGINSQSQLFSMCWTGNDESHQNNTIASHKSVRSVQSAPFALMQE